MNRSASEQIPFFVYGTLIPGQPNDHLWGGGIKRVETAVISNGALYDMGYYPMLVEGVGGIVQGKLISVANGVYDETVRRLDYLEGYVPDRHAESTYRRVKRAVISARGRKILSWVYLGRKDQANDSRLIVGGDWVVYAADLGSRMDDWWESIDTVFGRHNDMDGAGS